MNKEVIKRYKAEFDHRPKTKTIIIEEWLCSSPSKGRFIIQVEKGNYSFSYDGSKAIKKLSERTIEIEE